MNDLANSTMTTTSPPKRIDFNTPELQRKRRIRALKDRFTRWYVLVGGLAVLAAMTLALTACSDEQTASNSAASPPRPAGPCSMATVDEMSHTLGVTFTSAKSGTPDGPNGCWYEGRDADGSDIAVQVNVFDLAQFDSV